MNLRTRPREEPHVDLTSLIDVVFLLLIFFMVSTSFVKESQLTIRLPEAATEPVAATEADRLEIAITETGTFFVNGRELVNNSPVTLRRALEEVSGGRTDLPVTIVADADARHQSVVTAMDVAGRLGFVRINVATVSGED
jgi:biopolymer transport protein ExbD